MTEFERLRIRAGLTIAQLATEADISRSTIEKIEKDIPVRAPLASRASNVLSRHLGYELTYEDLGIKTVQKELRKYNYSPILFDFVKPASRDLTETVSTLAHLARFIVVDITDPGSSAKEVATIVPQTLAPLQPLLSHIPQFD